MKGDGESLSLSLGSALPMPNTRSRSDYPKVPFWERDDYARFKKKEGKKGETDGVAATSVEPVTKRGRPTDDDAIDDSKTNDFLHNADGTRLSKASLRYLSAKARRAWFSLKSKGMAPPTFTQITKHAWEFYARTVLNNPKLEFLLLCDNAEWKLHLWSVKAYPTWSGHRGLREVTVKPKEEKGSGEELLDDEDLIRMGSEDDWKDPKSVDAGHDKDLHRVNDAVRPSPIYALSLLPFHLQASGPYAAQESEVEDPL